MTELQNYSRMALGLIDLTSLNEDDTDRTIIELCQKANTQEGATAAVCVYPRFVQLARKTLNDLGIEAVKVATVTNFPEGKSDVSLAVKETQDAVAAGADEVDVVFPYQALIAGDEETGFQLIKACKAVCADKAILKVIIESGVLDDPSLIEKASDIAIQAGADFIKTSTGKVSVNATLAAAEIMMAKIKENDLEHVGFKAAGGIRTAEEAMTYLKLAESVMGEAWVNAAHFRFGASSLLDSLLATISGADSKVKSEGY